MLVGVALQLHQAALLRRLLLGALDISVLPDLGDMEPPADGHADAPAVPLQLFLGRGVVDLLDVVKRLARLDGEEGELVPCRGDHLDDIWQRRLGHLAVLALAIHHGEEAQGTAPFGLPRGIRVGQVQDVADFARTDDVVVAQEVAAGGVDVDGHVGLAPAQGPAVGDARDVVAEGLRVEAVAQGEQRRELRQGVIVEAVEIRKVAALVDLVDVGLLGGEVDVGLDLGADLAQEVVVDEIRDDAVLVGGRRGILRGVLGQHGFVEEAVAEPGFGILFAESCGGGSRVSFWRCKARTWSGLEILRAPYCSWIASWSASCRQRGHLPFSSL